MPTERLVFLVEEPSMEAVLRAILLKIIGPTGFQIHSYQGKTALLRNLPARLRAYSKWMPANWCIVVIVDRDDDDCHILKSSLEQIAINAGLTTRSRSGDGPYHVVNRLAVEELEAWYFGDWQAVCAAYPRVPRNIPNKAPYRDSDAISRTWEAFERILQDSGYFRGGLRKVEAARAIAVHMNPQGNGSASFQSLRIALEEIAAP